MLVNSALKIVAPFIPVAGSGYGFAKTCHWDESITLQVRLQLSLTELKA